MRTSFPHAALLALPGSFLLPLTAAPAWSSPADSVHFCQMIDPGQWEREQSLPAAKRTAVNASPSRIVRLFYFLPNDRTYRASTVERMKTGILEVQSWYAGQMEAHGYGKKTFQVETDAQGVPIVHRVDGDHSDSHYKETPRPDGEVRRAFDFSETVQLIILDISRSSGGRGVGTKKSGVAIVDGGWRWDTAAHELGHAFGLQHDFRNDEYIMSYGSNPDSLSACAAQFLAVNPYFNPNVPFEEGSSPTVELLSPTEYSYGPRTLDLEFRVSDPDGTQQAILFAKTPPRGGYNRPSGFMEVLGCGTPAGTYLDGRCRFHYGGNTPFDAEDGNVLNRLQHTIHVGAVDRDGNRINHPPSYTLRAINIPEANVPVCGRSPNVRESIFNVVRMFSDRNVSGCEQITNAHLDELSTVFVNHIHATDSPLKANDFDGLRASVELRLDAGFTERSLLPARVFAGFNGSIEFKYYKDIYGDDSTLYPILPFAVGLKKVGEGRFKAVVPVGALWDMVLPLRVVNGSINGGATEVAVLEGRVESEPLTVTRTSGTTAAVTVDIDTLPSVSVTGNSGYRFYRSSFPLQLFSPLAGAPTPVADRTPQVFDAIVQAVPEIDPGFPAVTYLTSGNHSDGITEGAFTEYRQPDLGRRVWGHYVSEAHLAAITSLNLSNGGGGLGGNWFSSLGDITALKPGDLDGLTNLDSLYLSDNQLSSLPDGFFDHLTNLELLSLGGNQLSALPDGLFDHLANLESLSLGNNQLSSLPDGFFDHLTSLKRLYLYSNQLSALPDGLFDHLTNLEELSLNSNRLSSLPDGLFDHLTKLKKLILSDNPLSLQESDFDHLTNLETLILPSQLSTNPNPPVSSGNTPVADRTADVRDAIVAAAGVNSPGDVTGTHLAAIEELDLSESQIAELKPGDFDQLTGLKALALASPQLRSLPEGIFDNLTSLTVLVLGGPQLSSLPDGIFDNLTHLRLFGLAETQLRSLPEGIFDQQINLLMLFLSNNQLSSLPEGLFGRVSMVLDLSGNQLSSVPDGLFKGIFSELPDFTGIPIPDLASLLSGDPNFVMGGPIPEDVWEKLGKPTTVNLGGNLVDPLPLAVSVEKVANGQFKVVVPAGAPFDMELPLHVVNGTLSGGATTTTVPAGSVESAPLTVTRTPGTTAAVTVMGTLPELPGKHSGYALVRSADPPLVLPELAGGIVSISTPVCDRTPQVRDKLVASVRGISTCGEVTGAHLAAIESGSFSGNFTALKPGDFDGLTNLERLGVGGPELSSLPGGIFDHFANLTVFRVLSPKLSSLPAGVFDQLTNLEELVLQANQLSSLPKGIFDHLTKLEHIELYIPQLSSVPDGLFDQLTNLTVFSLQGHQLSSLPDGLFDQPTKLTDLYLSSGPLSSLPEGIFEQLTNLETLYLADNQLSSLPDSLFGGLTALTTLRLQGNSVDPLPLAVSLEKVADGQFKAVAPAGAPFAMVLPLTVVNGSVSGGATTTTIPAGSVESVTLTVTRTSGTNAAVTVDVGTLPGLPAKHSGYALVKSSGLPLEVISDATAGAETDFNGDGKTDFADFFLLIDAYGGTDPRYDLDGSGTVDFVDFFLFIDAFRPSVQAKMVAMAQEMIGLPSETQLQQNAPNPFNSETVISWFLLEPGPVRLEVFSLTGQRVAVLHRGPKKAGYHRLHWEGRDDQGRPLASGVYLYRLATAEGVLTRKLTLLR